MAVPERKDVLQRHEAQGVETERERHGTRGKDTQRGERKGLGARHGLGEATLRTVPRSQAVEISRTAEGLQPQGAVSEFFRIQTAVRSSRLDRR